MSGNKERLVALVIGATGGIGSEVALNFARRGYAVIIHGRNKQKLNELHDKIAALNVPVLQYSFDICDYNAMASALAQAQSQISGIDILVCAQGYFSSHLIESNSLTSEFEKTMEVNYKGCVYATKAVFPYLGQRSKGAIIYISSFATTQLGNPGNGSYVSTKAAVAQYARSVLDEVRAKGIKVTVLYPNIVNSPIGIAINNFFGILHQIEKEQMTQPADIAQSINYVIDQSSSACPSDIYLSHMKQSITTLELFVEKKPLPPPRFPLTLTNRVCYITGASKGIGRTIAIRMATRGYDLALVSRSLEQLNETRDLCYKAIAASSPSSPSSQRIECFSVDVTNLDLLEDSVHQTVQRLGNINVIINNAGINKRKTVLLATRELWDQVIATNFTSAIHATRTAVPYIARNSPTSNLAVMFISSAVILQPGQSGIAPYFATKHGINGFVGSLFEDVRHLGIKVSTICPGLVNTEIGTKKGPIDYFPPELLIQTDDCANVVDYVLDSPLTCCPYKIFIHPQHGTVPSSLFLLEQLRAKL